MYFERTGGRGLKYIALAVGQRKGSDLIMTKGTITQKTNGKGFGLLFEL